MHKLWRTYMRGILLKSVLLCACLTTQALAQSSNARVSGTVNDATGAVLPGVEVTATNNATGVVSTALSNDAGAYNFASLLPGVYTISASLPSFQTQTYKDVQLGNAAQVRLNFALQVGQVATAVESHCHGEAKFCSSRALQWAMYCRKSRSRTCPWSATTSSIWSA